MPYYSITTNSIALSKCNGESKTKFFNIECLPYMYCSGGSCIKNAQKKTCYRGTTTNSLDDCFQCWPTSNNITARFTSPFTTIAPCKSKILFFYIIYLL